MKLAELPYTLIQQITPKALEDLVLNLAARTRSSTPRFIGVAAKEWRKRLMNDLSHTCFLCHRIYCPSRERRRSSRVVRAFGCVLIVKLMTCPLIFLPTRASPFTFGGAMGLVLLYREGEPKSGTGMMHQVRNVLETVRDVQQIRH